MGKFKDFSERRKIGTYVSCDYTADTTSNISFWCVENLVPSPLAAHHYHTTVLYSRTAILTAQEILDKMDQEFELSVVGFKLFNSTDNDPNFNALVLELAAPELVALHKKLIAAGGTHDYPDYTPHVTVSYSAPADTDLSILSLPKFKFKVNGFKTEPLDLNWNA